MSPLSIIPPQSPTNQLAQSMAPFQQPCYLDYGGGAVVVFNAVYDPAQYYYQQPTTYIPSPTGNNNVFTFPPGPETPPLNVTLTGQHFIPAVHPEMMGQPQVQCQ